MMAYAWSEEKRAAVVRLAEEGFSVRQIAGAVDTSPSVVQREVKRLGVKLRCGVAARSARKRAAKATLQALRDNRQAAARKAAAERFQSERAKQAEVVREMYATGARISEVAERLGCSESHVRILAREFGFKHPGGRERICWLPEQDAAIDRGYRAGVAIKVLASDLGRSVESVTKRAAQLGIRHARATGGGELKPLAMAGERGAPVVEVLWDAARAEVKKAQYGIEPQTRLRVAVYVCRLWGHDAQEVARVACLSVSEAFAWGEMPLFAESDCWRAVARAARERCESHDAD